MVKLTAIVYALDSQNEVFRQTCPLKTPRKVTVCLQKQRKQEKHTITPLKIPKTPLEVRDKVTTFKVKPEFREDIESISIPQFFQAVPASLCSDGLFLGGWRYCLRAFTIDSHLMVCYTICGVRLFCVVIL